mgnify:FL=1
MIQRYFLLILVGVLAGISAQWWLLILSITALLYFFYLDRGTATASPDKEHQSA